MSTAAPAAALVRLLARGRIDAAAHSLPRRCVDPDDLFPELERRGLSLPEVSRMKVGVPTEIKPDEYRVAMTPAGVRELAEHGHEVLVQAGAGQGSAIEDDEYVAQGATIVPDAEAVFAGAALVLKVKEPQPREVALLREGQMLFTYLHLAAEPELTPGCARRARPASPTRRSRTRAGGCRCSRR